MICFRDTTYCAAAMFCGDEFIKKELNNVTTEQPVD